MSTEKEKLTEGEKKRDEQTDGFVLCPPKLDSSFYSISSSLCAFHILLSRPDVDRPSIFSTQCCVSIKRRKYRKNVSNRQSQIPWSTFAEPNNDIRRIGRNVSVPNKHQFNLEFKRVFLTLPRSI